MNISFDQPNSKSHHKTIDITNEHTISNINFFSSLVLTFFSMFVVRKLSSKNHIKSPWIRLFHFALIFIKLHHGEKNEETKNKLKLCAKVVFLSTDTISLLNDIEFADFQNELAFLIILSLNRPYYQNYYQSLLLLSSDVNLNPGPVLNNNIWEPFDKKGIHLLHININSLLPKINELREIAGHTKASIIGISESKLDDSIDDNEIDIPGYSVLRSDRNRHGGGVACYVKNELCFNRETIISQEIEHIIVSIFIPKCKPIKIGIFYRPPGQNNFLDILMNELSSLNTNKSEVYLLGDFNINLLQRNQYVLKENLSSKYKDLITPLIRQYKEFCQFYSLKQFIREPTRITCDSSSLIDHILSNAVEKVSASGLIDIGISDHQLIFCTRKILRTKNNFHQKILGRSFKNYEPQKFVDALERIIFPNYDIFSDIDVAYTDFLKRLTHIINSLAPFKEVRIKNNTKDWFDMEIRDKIKTRISLHKKFKKSRSREDENIYKIAKHNVEKIVKQKKRDFYQRELEQNIGKPKELWKTLKSLGLPSKKTPSSKICLKKEDIISFDDTTNASIFKEFYSNLADDLVKKLPKSSEKFGISSVVKYYAESVDSTISHFKLKETTENTIYSILQSLNIDKAAGIDNISSRFLKDGANILKKPICQICNLSIKLSKFPNQCKIAKLKPLFKKGSKTDPRNYRPVSLLPIISKVIEKTIHEQTQDYLQRSNIFCRYQSGFRKNYSTESCLSYLCDKISKGFDAGLFTGLILIDLQKAFDTINHKILTDKMKCLGFSKETLLWFKSYLHLRQFKVNLNDTFSKAGKITCGVPQGSILGPLLFLLYINDIPQAVNCEILLYADDTCLFFQHKDTEEIKNQLNRDFSSLCEWFIDNKLSVHFGEDKTKSILFGSKSKIKKAEPFDIEYKNIKIKQYKKVTYLGCILDDTLSGESMALNAINKINNRLRFLYRQDKFLNKSLRRLLCNAIIQPFFDYACSTWYPNLTQNLKNRLQATQNKCIKYCLKIENRTSVKAKDFEDINWLNVEYRFNQIVASNVFKFFLKCGPDYMDEIYFPADQVNIRTRFSYQKLKIPKRKTTMGMKNLSYIGPSFWNKLPSFLKYAKTLNSFKHKIKEYFFTKFKIKDK